MGSSGPETDDRLTRLASGLLAGAVMAVLGAAAVIWWYRQAAEGWAAPSPRLWAYLLIAGMVLSGGALVLSIVAIVRRSGTGPKAGGVAWAILSGAVLIASPIVVERLAPDGRHAVVVAIDAETGDVRWRAETGAWFLRDPTISGDVVTVLTVGDDRGPCDGEIRLLTLGLADGDTISLEPQPSYVPQSPPADYAVQGGDLVRATGADEMWRVKLDALGLPSASAVAAGSGVVVVTSEGRLPLTC